MIIAGTFAATALTFLLIYAGTGSFLWALFALGVPYLVREWVIRPLPTGATASPSSCRTLCR